MTMHSTNFEANLSLSSCRTDTRHLHCKGRLRREEEAPEPPRATDLTVNHDHRTTLDKEMSTQKAKTFPQGAD
jgi:hypothetical protein